MTTTPSHGGLPTRLGVSPSCVGLPAGDWPTFTDFLVQRFPAIARETWLERMAAGLVVDEFGTPVTAERPYRGHMRLYYYRALPAEARIPFEAEILFRDEHLVVADKPHFLPVTPSGHYLQETLLVRLKNQLGLDSLIPIHRIDRETAGLVVFCIKPSERDAYQALFRRQEVHKHYQAIAPRRDGLTFPLRRSSRIMEDALFFRQSEVPGPANSETLMDLLEIKGRMARYALSPVTGKKHQLRVHMNALAIPILNDRLYPVACAAGSADDYSQPLQLLAHSLAFEDPVTKETRRFQTRLSLALGGLGA